jgi:hypothetical protein
MARFILLAVVVLFGARPCCAQAPKLFHEKPFTCATLADAANHSITLKEKAAIKELESLVSDWDTAFKRGSAARCLEATVFRGTQCP